MAGHNDARDARLAQGRLAQGQGLLFRNMAGDNDAHDARLVLELGAPCEPWPGRMMLAMRDLLCC